MTAMQAPRTSRNQPMRLPARRTISAPSVAYKTAAGAAPRFVTTSEGHQVAPRHGLRTAPASESTVTETHTVAVAPLEPVTGMPLWLAPA